MVDTSLPILELLTVSGSSGTILLIIGKIYLKQINKSFEDIGTQLKELKRVLDNAATKQEIDRIYKRVDEMDHQNEQLSQRLSRLQGAHDVWHSTAN